MTPIQRETIREVIGHLWTIEEQKGTDTMSGNYAEQLTDMLAVDKPEEEKPSRGITMTEAARIVADYLNKNRNITLDITYFPNDVQLTFLPKMGGLAE